MNQEYFEKISDMVKKAQEPLIALAELNVKTLQGYNYLKPDELSKITKPEELLEKQVLPEVRSLRLLEQKVLLKQVEHRESEPPFLPPIM